MIRSRSILIIIVVVISDDASERIMRARGHQPHVRACVITWCVSRDMMMETAVVARGAVTRRGRCASGPSGKSVGPWLAFQLETLALNPKRGTMAVRGPPNPLLRAG